MRIHLVRRILLVFTLPLLTLGAECDLSPFFEVFCANHPGHPRCTEQEEELPPAKIVFVTSTTHPGSNIGGLEGGDRICTFLAGDAMLPGTFVAWLSDLTVDAKDRLTEPGGAGFVRTDGAVVATSIADLIDGAITNPIQLDENGIEVSAGSVWTGTKSDGTAVSNFTCDGWLQSIPAGRVGALDATDATWTDTGGNRDCDTGRNHLYCFEI